MISVYDHFMINFSYVRLYAEMDNSSEWEVCIDFLQFSS